MRTVLIAALLAGVATTPALARPHDDNNDGPRRERSERSESRESAPRQERSVERPQRSAEPRSQSFGGGNPQSFSGQNRTFEQRNVQAVEQVHRRDAGDNVREWRQHEQVVETGGNVRQRNFEAREVRPPRNASEVVSSDDGDTVRNWRSRERHADGGSTSIEERNMRRAPVGGGGDLVQQRSSTPRVFERAERRISRRPVFGTEPPAPRTATAIAAKPARHWNSDWRRDHRYDWRDWRRHHRSHFRIGFYYDPFGWDYMRYGVGWRLWPSYYGSSFWLNDPWQYRLPPAYGPYRWIRYYNDALLVNIYTGQVVDVEYDVFWW